MLRSSLVTCALIALTLTPAAAQQATQAQRDALRASCRSDFMANCSGVQPGGKEAFECLAGNEAKLSAPCRNAVSAIANPSPSPAAPVPSAAAPASTPNAASPSLQRQSSTPAVPPAAKSSHPPAAAVQKTPVRTTTLPATPAATPSETTTAPTVAPLGPIRPMLPRRALMILAQCRPEQQRLCAGVPAGGGKILDCLAANAQQLSPICYDALARVSQ